MEAISQVVVTTPRRCKVTSGEKCHYSEQRICNCCECLGMIEATPTFALPNQFLVWVAKKVLAQSDLDLVLTEYYKERLESRLKNRETHTNGLILTESTNSTGLRIPTDWIPCTKPSSTRLIFICYPYLGTAHI